MKDKYRNILSHAIGHGKIDRNYFASAPDCDHWPDCWHCVMRGWMSLGKQMPGDMGGMTYFHVTSTGRKALNSAADTSED